MKKYKLLVMLILLVACLWLGKLALSPTQIIAVHRSGYAARIILKNPPLTRRTKLLWWKHNRKLLEEKYNLPRVNARGEYYVSIWDYADGYKEEEDEDRLCFEDKAPPKNCIVKKWVMTVEQSLSSKRVIYSIGEDTFETLPDGKIVKQHFTFTVR
ncbi:DUF943 family protein [Siccibacter colletis]|uniref:DUF943 family protein n=1 Tax=Siccibacter colletis TaxID=1505757 RepID=UPI003CEB6EE2